MNVRRYLAFGLGAAALVGIPTVALAQFPPDPPATFYGSAAGGSVGQGVIGIVIDGSKSTTCGAGNVVDDSGPKYVTDVVSNSQLTGCGSSGRTVRFYFTPSGSTPGNVANESGTWSGAGPEKLDLTQGSPLTNRLLSPNAANDGVR